MDTRKKYINIDTNEEISFLEETISRVAEPDAAGVFGVFLKDGNCIMCANIPEDVEKIIKPENIPPEPTDSEGTQAAPPANNPKISDIASVKLLEYARVKVTLKSGDTLVIPDAQLA